MSGPNENKVTGKDLLRKGMERAFWAAQTSHDPDTQTGCAFFDRNGHFLTCGANRIPFPVPVTVERTARPAKYNWIEHSERNAIYGYDRLQEFEGSTAFLNWFPCADCARALVAVRVARLVYVIKQERWADPRYGFDTSKAILEAGGVELVNFEEAIRTRCSYIRDVDNPGAGGQELWQCSLNAGHKEDHRP